METYELTYIVSPEITSEEAQAKAKEIESTVGNKEGTILRQSDPIAKTLSYPIKKRASGFLGVLEFQLEPEKLLELEESLAKDGKIVRHIVIIKKAKKPKKERRTRIKPSLTTDEKMEPETVKKEKLVTAKTKADKEKVELKDIEQQLDEILG